MNKFRELGFIDYNGTMEVHSSLLSVVLHDQPQMKKRTWANFQRAAPEVEWRSNGGGEQCQCSLRRAAWSVLRPG
jgi:hypothetical protein